MPGEYLPPVVTRLTGDLDDLIRKVEEAKALIKSLDGTTVRVGFDLDQGSLARAQAAAQAAFAKGVTVPVRFDVNAGGAAARAFAGGAAGGLVGGLLGLAGRGISLFGGVLPGVLGSVGAIHLLIDGIAEVLAIVIPATIALAAFGFAASDAVNNIIRQFTNIHTVMDATGQVIPPMTNAMEQLHKAVQPQVYSMLGDALTIINNKAGEFAGIAKGAADALSYFAARATVAITSQGMSGFLRNAVSDVSGLFNVFGNLAGTLGAVLKNLPGYAQVFLNVLQSVTHGVEVFANSGIGQGLIRFGLAFHGAFIYIGLLGTAVARIIPMILGWVTKLGDSLALTAVRAGFTRLADGIAAFSGGAEAAAALPWGWIALVAAGIGVLAYKVMTAKDATQQWTQAMQTALMSKTAGLAGFTALAGDQVQTISKLTAAQIGLKTQTVGQAQAQTNLTASVHLGTTGLSMQAQRVTDLNSRQTQLTDETNLYNYRLGILAQKYGGAAQAQALLTQAGVKMSQMLDKSSQAWKIVQQMVSGVVQGYAAMAQRGGQLGADLFVLNQQATDQYTAMQKLNQAWQTFTQTISTFQGSAVTVIQTLRTMKTQADANGASFTGVNARSLTLQGTFENQLVPQLQNVIQGMRQAHDSANSMGTVIATFLNPTVHEGALQNAAMRTQIYDMARQAGYTGPNAIRPLTNFVDTMKTSFFNAMQMIRGTGAALGRLPHTENLSISVHGTGQWLAPRGMAAHVGFASGGRIPGFGGGDIIPILAEPGEAIVDKYRARKYAGTLAAMGVKGFTDGGIIPHYSGSARGLGPWATHDYNATANLFANALAQSFQQFMGSATGGRSSAGGQYTRSMLANLWQQAGGPGGYIALTAAAIALAESGGNPLAWNPSGASGLWQILGQVVPGYIFNPFTNALNAVSKFDSARGFSPWTTYTTGAYRAFMDNGGWLMPGNTLVTNNTGEPERVLSPSEMDGGDIIIQIDGQTVFRVMQKHARRYNRRNGVKGSNKAFLPG